jgi:hypothetical protein
MKFRAEKKRLKKLAHEQCLRKERIKSYKEFLEQETQAKKDKQELRKWEIMQRLKENEANHKFYKDRYEKTIKDIEETRNIYEQQIVSLRFCQNLYMLHTCAHKCRPK